MSVQALRTLVMASEPLDGAQRAQLLAALDSHEKLLAVQQQVGAFDWSILLKLLPLLATFFPQFAPLIDIINQILAVLSPNTPPIVPTPPGGGGDPPPPAN